jgi:hypothetical protein
MWHHILQMFQNLWKSNDILFIVFRIYEKCLFFNRNFGVYIYFRLSSPCLYFSQILWECFEKFKESILDILKQLVLDISQDLHDLGISHSSTEKIQTIIQANASQDVSQRPHSVYTLDN